MYTCLYFTSGSCDVMVGGSVTSGTRGVLEGMMEETQGRTGEEGAALMGRSNIPTDRTNYTIHER